MFEQDLQCGIIEQFVSDVVGFSSQYGNDNTISYTACNVTGKPTVFPSYGDFTQTFALRTYGPRQLIDYGDVTCCKSQDFFVVSQDFIDVKFEQYVFPFRLDLFETYNPGALVRVMAYNNEKERWTVLWAGHPDVAPPQSRIFSPILRRIPFQTNMLRLEFYQRHLSYHYELDAVRLVGSSVISFLAYSLPLLDLASSRNVSTEHKKRETKLDSLPGELLTFIFSFLDLESLCHCACVSRKFRNYCYSTSLYKHLNLQPYWHKVNGAMLESLVSRCTSLQALNLSWCRNIVPSVFERFLKSSGGGLQTLQLSCYSFLTWECCKAVADFCPHLTDLGLQNIRLDHSSYVQISRLTALSRLDLFRTPVDAVALAYILRSCLHIESLGLGACLTAGDQTVAEISKYARRLRHLDLWRAKQLSAVGIRGLAEGCPLLEKINLGWCLEVDAGTGCIRQLVACCPRLTTLILTSIRTLCNEDVVAIATRCKKLHHLDVLGSREIGQDSLLSLLKQCPELEVLDVSFCAQIDSVTVRLWRSSFPSVDIKRSYQLLLP